MPDSFKRRIIKQLIIAISAIALIAVIIIVLNVDINKRVKVIEDRRRNAIMQAQAIRVLSELKKDAPRARLDYALLQGALPDRDQLISFPRELEQLAKASGVDLGFSFGSEAPSTDTQPGNIRFTMSLSGTLESLLSFLKVFENHRYFINLSSVDLTKREESRFALTTSGEVFTR